MRSDGSFTEQRVDKRRFLNGICVIELTLSIKYVGTGLGYSGMWL